MRIFSIMHGVLFVPIEVSPEWTELPFEDIEDIEENEGKDAFLAERDG